MTTRTRKTKSNSRYKIWRSWLLCQKVRTKCFDFTLRLLHTNSKGLQLTLGIMGNSQISQNDLFLLDLPNIEENIVHEGPLVECRRHVLPSDLCHWSGNAATGIMNFKQQAGNSSNFAKLESGLKLELLCQNWSCTDLSWRRWSLAGVL